MLAFRTEMVTRDEDASASEGLRVGHPRVVFPRSKGLSPALALFSHAKRRAEKEDAVSQEVYIPDETVQHGHEFRGISDNLAFFLVIKSSISFQLFHFPEKRIHSADKKITIKVIT